MQVIRHVVYRNQLLLPREDDARDVFLKLVIVIRLDEALPAFDRKHDVDVDLRAGVGHARKMPLLTELENYFCLDSTKMSRLRRWHLAGKFRFSAPGWPAGRSIPVDKPESRE
jgi:hypothetical protein